MIPRFSPIRKRRAKPRRGRVADKAFLAWLAEQPCVVSGRRPVTIHHVWFCGSPKNDRRAIPLAAEFHMHDFGPRSIEKRGKRWFQEHFGINIEAEIERLNREYGK